MNFFARCYGWGASGEKNRPKISGKRERPPPIIFAWIVRPMNALQLYHWVTVFHINFVADFLQAKCYFTRKTAVLRFWGPCGGLGATYDDHLRLNGKHILDFLLVLTELFSLGWGTTSKYRWKSVISLQQGTADPKFHEEGVAPTNHSSSQKTRLNDLSNGMKMWTELSSILSQITHLTDRQTDGQTERQTEFWLL